MLLALALSLAGLADGLRVDWQAPADCPDAAALRGRVVAMIGEAAVAGADVQASARVRADAGRWTLDLELQGAGGQDRRTLVDRECEAVTDAAALVIAVAIDPQARAPVPGPGPEVVVPAPPVIEQPAAAVPVVAVPAAVPAKPVPRDTPARTLPVARRRVEVNLRLGAGLGFARILPRPHAALELALGVEGRLWRVELGGMFVPPVRGTAASDPTIGGSFRLGAGEVRGCAVPGLKRAPVYFPLCAGLQVGAMHGSGEGAGLAVAYDVRALWVATRIGGAVRWRFARRLGLVLGLDAIVALVRPTFITAARVPVHQAAPVGGQVSLGFEVWLR